MARRPRPQSTTAAGAVLLAAAMLAALPGAAAHGFMSQPASRNYIHSTFYPRTSAEKASIPESYWDVSLLACVCSFAVCLTTAKLAA